MSRLKAISAASAATCLLFVSARSAGAEEIEHKFRIAFSGGGYSITDQQHSGSANVRALLSPDGRTVSFLQDPRNDSGAFSDFGLEPQYGGVLSASYGIGRLLYVEASVGYRRGKVGNVQMQAMFDGVPVTSEQPNNFAIFNYDGGTIKQIPVEFTMGLRFRPKAALNPYLALGVGYSFNSFEPSKDLNALSLNLDRSTGGFARVTGTGTLELPSSSSLTSLSGFVVDAPNTPEWHIGGGLEYTFSRKWSVFLDARYTTYSGKFRMTVNGSDNLGISVPSDQILLSDPSALGPFGGYYVTPGLGDFGSWVPAPGSTSTCTAASHQRGCEFLVGPTDGVKDPGLYYIQAGRVRYDAASYQVGFKYTF